ncbi:MAG: putative cadmium-transporting ATPase [Firmicutes bacterium]|nr:putative cadmium-transporting ATPase [Bacillota bacterium]
MTVEGTVDPDLIVKAGEKHNVQVRSAKAPAPELSFWAANPHLISTGVAGLLIAGGWVTELFGPAWLHIGLYVIAILIGGWSVGRKGISSLLRMDFNMDALMTIAIIGAACLGQWSEGAVVAFLFGVSETLESYSMDRARQSLRSLMEIAPKVARVRRKDQEVELPVEEIKVGDFMIVRPGEKIAMDGAILAGASAIDQAAITGESVPVEKAQGDEVFAGTLNGSGALEVLVTKVVEDTTFAKILNLVEEAQAQRAPSQTLVEKFAKIYTPAVMLGTLLIVLLPPLLFAQPWAPWIYRGLSLLVVACPCALVVSTPVSILSAISNAARHGVLIKGGAHLERAGHIAAIAFDKTGTLTKGRPEVTDVERLTGDLSEAEVLSLAAAVETRSEHPLARAIISRAQGESQTHAASDFQAIIGRGASATVDGRLLYVGSPKLFTDDLGVEMGAARTVVERWQAEGKTVMLLGDSSHLLGAIAVADTVRESSASLIQELRAAGVRQTIMLTGDNARTAQAMGRAVAVDQVQADLMPQDKVAAVKALAAKYGTVAMVGDGVNDAPALAAASVGIAMGGAGTDVALETADIALMADDLSKLPFTIRLSRATLRVIKQNIGIALGLKLLAVAAVFPGWLTLWLAILADMGATIIVTLNGMRLLRHRP